MEPCLFAKALGATLDPVTGYFIRQATRQGCLFGDYASNSSMRKGQMLDGSENGREYRLCKGRPFRVQAAHFEALRRLAKSRRIPVQNSETPYVGSA